MECVVDDKYEKGYRNIKDIIEQVEEENEHLRHDILNHLIVIQGISNQIKESPTTENTMHLIEYVNKLGVRAEENKTYIKTGYYEVDLLLNQKISKLKKKGIKYSVKIELPLATKIKISDIDMVAMLGNILDNAIEASEDINVEDRFISFEIICDANNLVILQENSYSGIYDSMENKIKYIKNVETIKFNKEIHGIGLKSIERTVKKYGGDYMIYAEKRRFYTQIIFYDIYKEEKV